MFFFTPVRLVRRGACPLAVGGSNCAVINARTGIQGDPGARPQLQDQSATARTHYERQRATPSKGSISEDTLQEDVLVWRWCRNDRRRKTRSRNNSKRIKRSLAELMCWPKVRATICHSRSRQRRSATSDQLSPQETPPDRSRCVRVTSGPNSPMIASDQSSKAKPNRQLSNQHHPAAQPVFPVTRFIYIGDRNRQRISERAQCQAMAKQNEQGCWEATT